MAGEVARELGGEEVSVWVSAVDDYGDGCGPRVEPVASSIAVVAVVVHRFDRTNN